MPRARAISWLCFGLFLALFARVRSGLWPSAVQPVDAGQTESAWLLILAVAATVTWLRAELPVQNVAMATVVIASLAWAGESLGGFLTAPQGSQFWGEDPGTWWSAGVSWTAPALWVVILLNCRGTARLLLRPWRSSRSYGLWLLGFTVLLAAWFALDPDMLAGRHHSGWGWIHPRWALDGQPAPLLLCLGRAVLGPALLVCAAPWLMCKRPAEPSPGFQPLAVWFVGHLGLATRLAADQCWLVAGLISVEALGLGLWALRPELREMFATRPVAPAPRGPCA
jgi:hypothetical protein